MKFAARAAVAAPPLFLVVWIIAGLLDRRYSFFTGHGSDLALGSVAWLMTLNFVLIGLVEVGFGAALLAARRRVLGVLVMVAGLSLLASGVFQEDAAGHAPTIAGGIHNALFLLLFLAIVIAAGYSALREGGGWRIYSIGTIVGLLGIALVFMIAGSDPGDPLYFVSGIIQIVLVAVGFAWLSRLAARHVTRPVVQSL